MRRRQGKGWADYGRARATGQGGAGWGRAGRGRAGRGRAGPGEAGRVNCYSGIVMDRARDVQLSAVLQCCSSDVRPVQNQPSPADSNII